MPPQSTGTVVRSPLERANVWALALTIIIATLIVPLGASLPYVQTKAYALAAGTLITLALYILARLGRGNVILPPLALVGALWLPAIAYLLSALFSGAPFALALWGLALEPDTLGFMLVAGMLGTLAALSVRRPEHFRTFFRVGAFGFAVAIVIELLVLILGQIMPNTISPRFSIAGSVQDLSVLLGLAIVSGLLTLRFLEVSKRTRLFLTVGTVVALVVLIAVGIPLVWMLTALVAFGLFVESVMKRKVSSSVASDDFDDAVVVSESSQTQMPQGRSLVLPLVVLAVSLFFLIGSAVDTAIKTSLKTDVYDIRPTWQSMLSITRKTYSEAPFFGTGPGSFASQWIKYRDASLNNTQLWNLDLGAGSGFIPTSFVTTGLAGALAWVALIVLFLVLGIRTLLMRPPEDRFLRFAAILSFVATLYLLLYAIFGLPGSPLLGLTFVMAGIFASSVRHAAGKKQWGVIFAKSPRLGFVIVFLLTLVLLGAVGTAYAVTERYIALASLSRAANAFSAGNLDLAEASLRTSLSFAPQVDAYQLAAVVASARLNQIVNDTTMPKDAAQQKFQTTLSSGIAAALSATTLAPKNYQGWLALGNLYAMAVPLKVSRAYESAKSAFETARTLAPTNAQIPYILAQLEIANGSYKTAAAPLQEAIKLKQNFTAAIFLLSQVEVQNGNVKEALTAAESAAYFNPTDANILFQLGLLRASQNNIDGAIVALEEAVKANAQFANARYFLAAAYAKKKNYTSALSQIEEIAKLSPENATAVADIVTALKGGKDPFPANLLAAEPPVEEVATSTPAKSGSAKSGTPSSNP